MDCNPIYHSSETARFYQFLQDNPTPKTFGNLRMLNRTPNEPCLFWQRHGAQANAGLAIGRPDGHHSAGRHVPSPWRKNQNQALVQKMLELDDLLIVWSCLIHQISNYQQIMYKTRGFRPHFVPGKQFMFLYVWAIQKRFTLQLSSKRKEDLDIFLDLRNPIASAIISNHPIPSASTKHSMTRSLSRARHSVCSASEVTVSSSEGMDIMEPASVETSCKWAIQTGKNKEATCGPVGHPKAMKHFSC